MEQVEFVSLREAYVDLMARRGQYSATSRADLMREIVGLVYDAGLCLQGLAERWVDDEPLFDTFILCPDCRTVFAITHKTYDQTAEEIGKMRLAQHGGDTVVWRTHIKPQIAQDCGLN